MVFLYICVDTEYFGEMVYYLFNCVDTEYFGEMVYYLFNCVDIKKIINLYGIFIYLC
jgi:hypothetical protein